ncbi:MAG: hypothetical protein J6T41_05015 [Neisseriaceae bacterium]|nr:hypothetical protein [Neisseriaceae bacterium]
MSNEQFSGSLNPLPSLRADRQLLAVLPLTTVSLRDLTKSSRGNPLKLQMRGNLLTIKNKLIFRLPEKLN